MIQNIIEWLLQMVNIALVLAGTLASYKVYRLISLSIRALKVYIMINDPENKTAFLKRVTGTYQKTKTQFRRIF